MRLLFTSLLLFVSFSAAAETLTVINADDNGPGSLRQAVLDATDGDEIIFDPLLFDSTIVFGSEISITQDIQITGIEGNVITLNGDGSTRHFTISGGATVGISNLTLINGQASGGGSIDLISGDLTLTNCLLFNNNSSANGGAVDNGGPTLTLINSTLSNNTTDNFGGAINNPTGSALVIRNSTLSNNETDNDGGAITNLGGTLDITNSTVINNMAENCGGGIGNIGTITNVQNTIVTGNIGLGNKGLPPANDFCNLVAPTAVVSAGGNVIGQVSATDGTVGVFNQPNDQTGTPANLLDPLLGPLADNGGPTLTHLPLEGSPAIDAGLNTADLPLTDQRGLTRLVNENIDAGSVEVQGAGGGLDEVFFTDGFEAED